MVRRSWAPGGAIAILLLNELVRNRLLNIYGCTHRLVLPSTLATEASFCCGQQYRSAKSWEQVKVEYIAITRTSTPPTPSKANRTSPQRGRKAHKSGKTCCGWYVVDPTCLLYRWAHRSCGYLPKTRTRSDQQTQATFQLAALTRLGGFGGDHACRRRMCWSVSRRMGGAGLGMIKIYCIHGWNCQRINDVLNSLVRERNTSCT